MNTYLFITTIICLYFLLFSLKNKNTLKRMTFLPDLKIFPKVSLLLPVRNEEKNIAPCLDSLLGQDYPNYEILIIDDDSGDGTWEILQKYAGKDKRIRAYRGSPLAPGWVGKQYACQQLIAKATGEYLMFTDADTVHSPQSIAWAVTNILGHGADFMSAYLHQLIGSIGEALVVPAIYIMTTLLMPLWKIPKKNHPFFSFAIGQFMICRRECLLAIGGYNSFKDSLVDDMSMARAIKAHGYKTVFVDGKNYIDCRMYHTFRGAFRGLVKSMYAALHQNMLTLLLLFLVVGAVIEIPVFNLIQRFYAGSDDILFSLMPVGMFGGAWCMVLHDRRISPSLAVSYPLLFLMVMLLAVTSTMRTGFLNGVEWKGRLVKCRRRCPDGHKNILPDKTRIKGRNIYPLYTFSAAFIYRLTFALVILFNTLIFNLRIKGRENLKNLEKGGFLVSNHTLYLDPGLIAQAIAPRLACFSAMDKTFDLPFVGQYIRLLGAFPVSRDLPFRSLVRVVKDAMARGRLIHFFPEGDLHYLSRSLAPFKQGVFYLAWLLDKPIIPVVINPIPKRLLGKIVGKLFIRVEVTVCKPIFPHTVKTGKKGKSGAIQALARCTRKVMAQVLERA